MSTVYTAQSLVEILNGYEIEDYEYRYSPYGLSYDKDAFVVDQAFERGGISGGSCWESSDPRPYTTDLSYDLERGRFFQFISEFRPDTSFVKFSKFKKECLSRREWTDREYYGNETTYEVWLIDVEKLAQMLNDA